MTKVAKANNRKKYIIIVSAILVVIAGGAGWFLFQNNKTSTSENKNTVTVDDVSDVTVEARRYVDSNDIKGGSAYYDEKIKSADNDEVTQSLLIAKVDYLLQANDAAAAVETAKKAVANNADDPFAHAALARAYEANGQPKEAVVEYKAALDRLKGDEVVGRSNPRVIFEAKIKELES